MIGFTAVGFRIRKDGLLDARFGPRLGWRRGGGTGCGTLLFFLALVLCGLFVAPMVIAAAWVIAELKHLGRLKPRGGFRFSEEETEKLAELDEGGSAVALELRQVDAEGASHHLTRNLDGTFDRRNPRGRSLEDTRTVLLGRQGAIEREKHAIWNALTERYTSWGDVVGLVWGLRVVVVGWLVATALGGPAASMTAWWHALSSVGTRSFALAGMAAAMRPVAGLAAITFPVGYAIGGLLAWVARPRELAGRVVLTMATSAWVMLPSYAVLAGMGLGGLWLIESVSSPSTNTPTASQTDPDVPEAITHCGASDHRPTKKLVADWATYRCASPGGSPQCLARSEYSDTQGMGCPGDEMCCSPAAATR
jgi:hypothetical protein